MKINTKKPLVLLFLWLISCAFPASSEVLTLDETCTISILNRPVQAAEDGSWRLGNVPSFMGQIRARATCVSEGKTISGRTDYFTVTQSGSVKTGAFEMVAAGAVPVSLDFATGNNTRLFGEQTYFRLRVFANYADGRREDITRVSSGINYSISNPAIAQIDINGVLQGLSSGRVLITARKDGTSAVLAVTIVTTGDSDNDGLPDDFELANGLNPDDPIDAFEDQDGDGLSAADEYLAGTDLTNNDTDGDGLSDGEEAQPGVDGFVTNPLLADSDNDGVGDGLEVQVGTNPTDINDVDYSVSLNRIELSPGTSVLTFNSIQGADASVQLSVTGTTLDGAAIDLTRITSGTNYTSDNKDSCSFGGRDGEVFAGQDGACEITADNSGFSDTSAIEVRSFDPAALNYLRITGANNIDVDGDYAYIATNDGLVIVDVSNPATPVQTSILSLGTVVHDIKVRGQYAYLATETVALVVVDIGDVNNPSQLGTYGVGNAGVDLALFHQNVYIAAKDKGLWQVNIVTPQFPQESQRITTNNSIDAVAVSSNGKRIGVLEGFNLRLIDVPTSGLLQKAGFLALSNPADLLLENDIAYVADGSGLLLLDISDAEVPVLAGRVSSNDVGVPVDLALAGNFALLADTNFINNVPIVNISTPTTPLSLVSIDFTTLGLGGTDAMGIDADSRYVYVVTNLGLQIGQYQQFVDENALPPSVSITAPLAGESALEGGTMLVTAEATDDIAVASVSYFINDVLIYTDFTAPFEFTAPLPIATSQTNIAVQAMDYGGNSSTLDAVTITLQADSDYDGLSDNDELLIHGTSPYAADSDGDGLTDAIELALEFNALDADMDNDGLSDGEEVSAGTNPYNSDTDNDGMSDGFENRYGLAPLDPTDANADLDGDGFTNLEEFRLGFDPTSTDSDADGMPDEFERLHGLDPNNPDDAFGDLDNDGVPNGVEYSEGTDPSNPDISAPQVDAIGPGNAQQILANNNILVYFNESIKAASLSQTVVTLTASNGTVLEGTTALAGDGYVLSFNPVLNLALNSEFTFGLIGARDLAGNPMAVAYSTTLTTTGSIDADAPGVLSAVPYDGAQNVPVNVQLTLDFDEPLDPTVANDSHFYLYDQLSEGKVAGNIGINNAGHQLYFTPAQNLAVGRQYRLYASGITDLAGNACRNCDDISEINFATSFVIDLQPPQVIATTVAENTSDMPLNGRMVVKLDEAVRLVNAEDVSLISNGTAITTNVVLSADRRLLTITPDTILVAGAAYTLQIAAIADLSGNVAQDWSLSFTAGDQVDNARGSITHWSMSNRATAVPLNPLLQVRFSERVDITGINVSSFYLYNNTDKGLVKGSWALSDNDTVLTFTAAKLLEPDHEYDWFVSNSPSLTDLAGNTIAGSIRTFTTGSVIDNTPPVILQSNIEQGSAVMPVNGRIVLALDEPIGDSCRPAIFIESASGIVTSSMTVSADRRVLTIVADSLLAVATIYQVRVEGLCDYAGNALSAQVLSFTTQSNSTPDTTGPGLLNISPQDNATIVALDSQVVLEFDEPIDRRTLVFVSRAGENMSGDTVVTGNRLVFTPTVPLLGGTRYTISMGSGVYDLAGNLRSYSLRRFTTISVVDTTAPRVIAISPAANSVAVYPNSTINLSFSEPMATGLASNSTVALITTGTVIRSEIFSSADGQQMSLSASMPSSSIISVVLTDDFEDLAGNKLEPFISSFTTGAIDNDHSRPRVVKQVPVNGSEGWLELNEVVLYLDEPMDVASVADAFHVAQNGVVVEGAIEVLGDNRTIKFTAIEPFTLGSRIQVFLQSLATDESGNAVFDYNGYFLMAEQDERIGNIPVMVAFSPDSSVADVPLNPVLLVRYNEPLSAAALNSAVITLRNNNDDNVPLTVSLDSSGYLLQVTPDELLLPGTRYDLSIKGIVDTDGDINANRDNRYFSTAIAAITDDRFPMVMAASPFDGAVDVGINAMHSIRFDEPVSPLSFINNDNKWTSVLFSVDRREVFYEHKGTLAPLSEIISQLPKLRDFAGNTAVSTTRTYITTNGPDFVPAVVEGIIRPDAIDVATNALIGFRYSEAISPVSLSSAGTYLYDEQDNIQVPASINLSVDGKRIDIVPTIALQPQRRYRYQAQGIRDLSGNEVNSQIRFTTGSATDVNALQVVSTTIIEGQTAVPTNVRLAIRFNEAVGGSAPQQISLTSANGAVPFNVMRSSDRTLLTIVPSVLLQSDTAFRLTVEGFADTSGNAMVQPLVINFITSNTAMVGQGEIEQWSFINGATDVALSPLLQVRFSKAVDPTSVTTQSIFLELPFSANSKISGSWVLTENNTVLTFTPLVPLQVGREYRLVVGYSPYFKDVAGNRFKDDRRSFTTGSE